MDVNTIKELSESYVRSSESQPEPNLRTIADCLRHHAATRPNMEAFVFARTNGDRVAVSWKQLYEKSALAAHGFVKLGVRRGEFVAVNVRGCPEWLYINFGIILTGAVVVNIAFTYTDGSDVVATMEKLGTCSTMVLDVGVDENNWNIFRKLIDDYSTDGTVKSSAMPSLRYLLLLNRPSKSPTVKTFGDMVADSQENVDLPFLKEDDVVLLFQTSGSTGIPKLVIFTHASLLSFCRKMSGFDLATPGPDFRVFRDYNDRPFTWGGGWPHNVYSGQTRVTRYMLDNGPEDMVTFIFDVVKREKCVICRALPPLLQEMISRRTEKPAEWPVEFMFTGGQPASKDLAKSVGLLCKTLITSYGATECGIVSLGFFSGNGEFKNYSCGKPSLDVAVKVVDDEGNIVPVGTRGEICIRGKGVFKGYWNDAKKTQAVLTDDGWFKSDDIGYLSKEGNLFVERRKSDMIIVGGMNVDPLVLETAIMKCPDVDSVMVVPLSHPVLYQVICACVIPVTGSNLNEEMLHDHCESVHNDKPRLFTVLPKYYLIMEKFPETSNGKTSRKHLAAIAEKLVKNI